MTSKVSNRRRNALGNQPGWIESLESRVLMHAGHGMDKAPNPHDVPGPMGTDNFAPVAPATPALAGTTVTDLLPDVFPWASEANGYINGWTLVPNDPEVGQGRTALRLTTAIPNIGLGAMYLRGGPVNADGTQQVIQRISRSDGSTRERVAGNFTYHAEHGHLHFNDYASYNLRAVTSTGGVGAIVATGDKVSFCLIDVDEYDLSLPNARQPGTPSPFGCGTTQGISVGWADVYSSGLPDQFIDVTDLPNASYWLEVNVDVGNHLEESNENNNTTRILIDLNTSPPAADIDDQISEALLTTVGSSPVNSLTSATDVDMWRFNVTAGQRVGFDIDNIGGGDTFLRIFNASGAELIANDDAPAPGETASGYESYVEYTFPSAGTFYAGVSGYGNSSYDPITGNGDGSGRTGPYTLRLTQIGVTPVADGNDQISEATSLAIGASFSANVSPGTDVDMYRFTVTAGQRVGFDIDPVTGSTLNSYLRIFNAAGTQLASNDNGAAPGESAGTFSYLEHTFTTAGTYYAGVSGAPNSAYSATAGTGDISGSSGGFTIRLVNIPVVVDTDGNDQISEAAVVNVGGSTSAQITPGVDVDMFRFTVVAGQRIGFDVDRPGGSTLDSYLRLFNASGAQLAANNDSAAPGETFNQGSYIDYRFASAGTYYVAVSGNANTNYNAVTGSGDVSGSSGYFTLILNNRGVTATSTALSPTRVSIFGDAKISDQEIWDSDILKLKA